MKKILQRFYKKQAGAVAIIVAVALVAILFGVLSLSIDLNRTQTSYTHNYNGTDAAALAGAEMWLEGKIDAIGKVADPLQFRPGETEMLEYAKKVLVQNFEQDQDSSAFLDNTSFKVIMSEKRLSSGKTRYSVKVDACALLGTPIANVPKHTQDAENPGKAKTCTTSTAGFDLGKLENAEVAFALDFTESMYWRGANQGCPPNPSAGATNPECPSFTETKAYALQQAMAYVFNTYFDSSDASSAFASIVPYTSFVNVYPYADNGLVVQGTDQISFDGKKFIDISPKSDGTYGTDAEIAAFYANADNAWSQYRPVYMKKTTGYDLKTYIKDPAFGSGAYTPFFTFQLYDGSSRYGTKNYSSILNRIPTIPSSAMLNDIIDSPNDTSFLPFDNYDGLVNDIARKSFVWDKTRDALTKNSTDPNEQYAKMVCYQYTVAAAADERVDGALKSSEYVRDTYHSGRDIELHESFPVQPLTNNYAVLNNVLDRYVANTRLIPSNLYNEDRVVDFQKERIDKARLLSANQKTSSIHGLMWAWFTINNAWQDIWDSENSLHEDYVGGDKSARDGSTGAEKLPSPKHFKHIILISDGFDNDGCDDVSGGTADNLTGSLLGRRNVCDAYTPIDSITDTQYNNLCTTIKTNNTSTESDDTSIHILTLDFNAGTTVTDPMCPKASGANNRFAKCSTDGEYYNNVTPAQLRNIFDNVFAGILTKAVPVRLLD